jgi:hypothetical protein
MNPTLVAVIASLLFSEASQSQSALASTPSSIVPIHVDFCRATISTAARILQLRFADVGPTTANAVVFTVQVGTWQSEIRDAGKFSPGIQIDHMFRLDMDTFPWTVFRKPVPQAECVVKQVDLIDGSHWPEYRSADAIA